jgi:uncharacterized membrane protein
MKQAGRSATLKGEQMNDDVRRFLELDLEYLHRAIDKFDSQRFAIKNWAITTSGALLALAISSKKGGVPLIGVFTLAFFFYVEMIYMHMQVLIMSRCATVSAMLQCSMAESYELPRDYTFGVRESFRGARFSFTVIPQILARRPELYWFYIGQCVIMALSAALLMIFR